jgi:hypothetical protein
MKNQIALRTLILTFIIIFAVFAGTGQEIEMTVAKLSEKVIRLSGAETAVPSPSGRFVAVQASAKIIVLPAENLFKSFAAVSKFKPRDGIILGFLPSDTLVYLTNEEIFGLDPVSQKTRLLLPRETGEMLAGRTLIQNEFVLVSDELIVSGNGDYEMGGLPGNIFRYDLRRKRLTKGSKIKQFWYAALSPSRNFILYEHGGEQSNFTDFYDVRRDRNYEAAEYFDFRKAFPEFRKTNAFPLIWAGRGERFLAFVASGEHPDDIKPEDEKEQGRTWLALFDIPARKIVWKKLTDKSAFPSAFQPAGAGKVLVNYGAEVYELSLANGRERKLSGIDGSSLVVSPDKKRIAFIKANRVLTAFVDGSGTKPIFELPAGWKAAAGYKSMGERPPLWLPRGNALIFFGELELLIARL